MPKLPPELRLRHTERVCRLIREGQTLEAADVHNAHVAAEFERARNGEVINLSDLLAAREELGYEENR